MKKCQYQRFTSFQTTFTNTYDLRVRTVVSRNGPKRFTDGEWEIRYKLAVGEKQEKLSAKEAPPPPQETEWMYIL